jgi:hypothetical protein
MSTLINFSEQLMFFCFAMERESMKTSIDKKDFILKFIENQIIRKQDLISEWISLFGCYV